MTSRIIPILMIVLSIAFFVVYVHPTYTKDIQELSSEIHNYDAVLESAKQFKEKQEQLAGQRDSIAPDQLARLEAFLPDSVDNVQLILDLNALAARSGILLSDLNVSLPGPDEVAAGNQMTTLPLEGQGPAQSLEVSVSAAGSYSAFHAFLDAVENSLRPLDITQISVKDGATGAPGGTIHSYDITFRIYWLR